MSKPEKPLGGKAYGSIGHLPQSRVGPGDWHVHEGQARICLEKPRKGDRIIVTEKLDGACMAVAKINGEVVGLTRSGYRATDGSYEHLRRFAPYVEAYRAKFGALLNDGERLCGEWLIMAHGTTYNVRHPDFDPFITFDLIRGKDRVLREEFIARTWEINVKTAALLSNGPEACSIETALTRLGPLGQHGAHEEPEGAVWRVEREGRVDFLAKYVRPDKIDGRYLENVTGQAPIWIVP